MPNFTGFIQSQIKQGHRSLVMLDKLAGQATVLNEVLARNAAAGVVIPATSATLRSDVEGICNQDISVADALTQVPAIEIFSGDTWVVDCTNNSDPLMNYQRMVLTDSTHVNNTGTDDANGIVEQVEPYGAPADKKILVRFV